MHLRPPHLASHPGLAMHPRPPHRVHKTALDSASNGSFMTRTVLDGTQLIENLAESSGSSSQEYDRSRPVHLVDSQKISERLEMIERLLKNNERNVHAVEQEGIFDQEEVSYVNGQQVRQGFNMNYRNHPNLSYRSQNVENPQDQVYPNPIQNTNTNQGFKPTVSIKTRTLYRSIFVT